MNQEIKRILIINNGDETVFSRTEIVIDREKFYVKEVKLPNDNSRFLEYIDSDFEYILFVNPRRWKNKSKDVEKIIIINIQFLKNNERYAICQPAIIYGNISENMKNLTSQIKSHTKIKFIDDAFLAINGTIIKNFSLADFTINGKIKWNEYAKEINFYGFQCCRLCNDYLEVDLDEAIEINRGNLLDSIDILNLSLLKKSYDIGIEFSFLDPIYNGTSEYALKILPEMVETFKKKQIRFQIIASDSIVKKFELKQYSDYIVSPEESQNCFYHLLFVPQQIYSDIAIEKINQSCFKFVFTLLDVIALRCNYLSNHNRLDIPCALAYKYCEEVIGLTKSSAMDSEMFFNERMINRNVTPILLTKEVENVKALSNSEKSEFKKKNILLVGNSFKHKAIEKALEQLNNLDYNIVVIGYKPQEKTYNDRIKFYNSGRESNELIQELYKNCDLILYPSLYEGFGLPVVAAIQMNKKILVFDSGVNRELKAFFDSKNSVYLFDNFSDLPDMIRKILDAGPPIYSNESSSAIRNWRNVSEETTNLLLQTFASQINFNRINERIYEVVILEIASRGKQIVAMNNTISIILNSYTLKVGLFMTWPFRKLKSIFSKT